MQIIQVKPDFLGDNSQVLSKLDLSISTWQQKA